MKMSAEKPSRATTGAELARMLMSMDRHARVGLRPERKRGRSLNGASSGQDVNKPISKVVVRASEITRCRVVALEYDRDESGALPAGHKVSWGALWPEGGAPVYQEVCGYGAARPEI